jgi:chlorophyllase
MLSRRSLLVVAQAALSALAACGGDDVILQDTPSGAGGGATSTTSGDAGSTSSVATTTSTGEGGAAAATTAAATTSAGAGGSSGEGGGQVEDVPDPSVDGPYEYAELDDTAEIAANGHSVKVHCAYPVSGPSAGPYPVVVIAHGFQLSASQYYGYVRRLASFGYVALTADYETSFFSVNNVENAEDLLGALDWAAARPELHADATLAGTTGHSLGGKLSLLAASMDDRVKASITLDPVDSSVNCPPQDCPDVSALMPLPIPTAFLGETTDATGLLQACAPAADNFETFYAGAASPSLEVTVLGANHMSFLDDVAGCGVFCSFCNQATASNAQVNGLSKAFVVAFYERHLRGDVAYDTYLTGAEAQARYVATGQAVIASK